MRGLGGGRLRGERTEDWGEDGSEVRGLRTEEDGTEVRGLGRTAQR